MSSFSKLPLWATSPFARLQPRFRRLVRILTVFVTLRARFFGLVPLQALSIFGDQNDVMQVRSTGFAILFANTVQET